VELQSRCRAFCATGLRRQSRARHARIYEAISKLINANQLANPITLKAIFDRDEALIELGGAQYLARLATCAITTVNVEQYGQIIADLARRRIILAACEEMRREALANIDRPATTIAAEYVERLTQAGCIHESFDVHDAGDIDITQIPPRGWLLGVSFCRKFISGLVSEGGGGKTATRYTQYLALASGQNLTGEHVHVRSRVLIVCLEDDRAEVERRIGAAMLQHGVLPELIKGWIHYCTPSGLKLLQTGPRGDHHAIPGALYEELRQIIKKFKIDLASVDPFVKAHGVSENDNNLIDQVCTMLADLSHEFDIAVDLISHARKGASEPGDAERDRGASAKRDAGRLMRTLTSMTTDNAALFGIDEKDRRDFIRLDDAKMNITRRSPDAMWFRLVGVPLGNRSDLYVNGDEVQTVVRWYPPDVFNKLDTGTIHRILDKIEAGPYDGGRYSPAANATDRAAWPVVQEFYPAANEKQAKHIIATWLKTGVLVKRQHEDPKDRHDHPSLFVSKRPGDTWDT
jgi:hypothetical protein